MVSPADPSPSLSYPGGWHTTAFSRGSGERPRRRGGAAANGRREGGVGSDRARDGVAFPRGRSETRRKRRRPRSRAIEARAEVRRARSSWRGTHSSRTPGVGAGGCTSRHREAPSLRISRRREWRERRGAARSRRARGGCARGRGGRRTAIAPRAGGRGDARLGIGKRHRCESRADANEGTASGARHFFFRPRLAAAAETSIVRHCE